MQRNKPVFNLFFITPDIGNTPLASARVFVNPNRCPTRGFELFGRLALKHSSKYESHPDVLIQRVLRFALFPDSPQYQRYPDVLIQPVLRPTPFPDSWSPGYLCCVSELRYESQRFLTGLITFSNVQPVLSVYGYCRPQGYYHLHHLYLHQARCHRAVNSIPEEVKERLWSMTLMFLLS